ncbi:hypothetical protein V6N13_115564 [Hibiscus sabdariffa]|uniref:HMA domain-containing protein n=1 Tax=Hibiscus sabdariffa TaxID=183260 RepID=A0ABR2CS44_9ROSI
MGNEQLQFRDGEILLKVQMLCEGCSSKVFTCLKDFQGVEEVEVDMNGNMVIVKGQKADPFKVLERVKKKYSRNVQLIFPIPKSEEDSQNKQVPKTNVVSLKMYMHCEGCVNDIKRRIERIQGVLNVEMDMKNSTVTIEGEFDSTKLVGTVAKRLGKYVEIVESNQEGNGSKKKGKEEEIMFHYPPQYLAEHVCPTQIFSDENISSCSVM